MHQAKVLFIFILISLTSLFQPLLWLSSGILTAQAASVSSQVGEDPAKSTVSSEPVTRLAIHPSSAKAHLPQSKPSRESALKVRTRPSAHESTEEEVINNILGRPEESLPVQPPSTAMPATPPVGASPEAGGSQNPPVEEKPQQHFSFLDPGAAQVLMPEFDYGIYSMNLRILDDYRQRIAVALETARQLSLPMPEEQVRSLLLEATQHRRMFDRFYLGGQTTAGLQEFDQSQRLVVRALALATGSPKVEGRAIWLDRGSIVEAGSPAELRKRLAALRQAGINIIYFETLNAGFPIYPSAILRQNPLIQNWDPLQVAVEEGHRLGMEVHAWVWVFAVGNRRHNALLGLPADYPGPILTEQGLMSEALRNRAGGLNVDDRQHEFWLSPASPRARDFLLGVFREIVSRYPVDGMQLDYIRYPFQMQGSRMGYESVGRDRFYHATGMTLDEADSTVNRMWVAWKTYLITTFVEQVATDLRKIRPDLKLSAAVFPTRRESRLQTIQQDWETWINHGWLDTLSPMSYTADPERLQELFDYVQASPRKHTLIYPGIALHRLDSGQLMVQLDALRQRGGLGSTLFAGSHLNQEKAETLGLGPYREQASLPPHRNVLQSLRTVVEDYREKFMTLTQKGMLNNLTPGGLTKDQADGIRQALDRLEVALGNPTLSPVAIPAESVQAIQQSFQALQALTQAWSETESPQHAFRVRYFQQDVQVMGQLVAYLADRMEIRAAATPGPLPFIPPADIVPPVAAAGASSASSPGAPPSSGKPVTGTGHAAPVHATAVKPHSKASSGL